MTDSSEAASSATAPPPSPEPGLSDGSVPPPRRLLQPPESERTRAAITVVLLLVLTGAVVAGTYWLYPTSRTSYTGQVRTYYIAADEVEWNYTPSETDEITGAAFGANNDTDALYTQHIGPYLGSTYLKCAYRQYTDASFSTEMPRPPDEAYLGLLGPVIYAEVGDTVHVTFRNFCRYPESIHPQGLIYAPSDSGTPYNGTTSAGGAVPPGGEFNYSWSVPPQAGPGPMDGSSILWTYQSGASLLNSSDTGLTGAIIVTAAGEGNASGAPSDVDQNIILYENIYNEANSPYLSLNILEHAPNVTAAIANESNASWQQSLLKYAINGYTFGTMPIIQLVAGQSVRWYVMAFGNDMHSVQWIGNPVEFSGESTDTVPLLPGVTAVADMTPTAPGVWLVQSDDENDLAGGMQERFQVVADPSAARSWPTIPPVPAFALVGAISLGSLVIYRGLRRRGGPLLGSHRSVGPLGRRALGRQAVGRSPRLHGLGPPIAIGLIVGLTVSSSLVLTSGSMSMGSPGAVAYRGIVRQYYIAADQVEWNYTPSGMDEVSGTPFGVSNPGQLQYTTRNATYTGTSYLKCVYRQYTNGNFTTEVPQPPWLGIMGPTIYASVGDTIRVEFKNNCEFPESVHPHGVFYQRDDEGALYNTSAPYDDGEAVPSGGFWNYTWQVPARAGPGPDDGCCVMWMYHSHVYEPIDVNSGLIGSIIITAAGAANPNGTPKGFGLVVPLLFNIFDESQSQYESYNVDHDALNQSAVNASGIRGCLGLGVDQTCLADPTWALWAESMRKYTINGYLYGNLPMIDVPEGTEVLWCLMGMGADFHTAAFDGNDLQVDGMATDVVPLIPAQMVDGVMWANNTGTFLIDSLTQQDLNGGMEARYTVFPTGAASPSLHVGDSRAGTARSASIPAANRAPEPLARPAPSAGTRSVARR